MEIRSNSRLGVEGRKEAIVDAASTLVRETGLTDWTLDDVAQRAEVSRGLVYRYFPGKDALLIALIERLSLQLRGLTADAADRESSGEDKMRASLGAYFDYAAANPALYRAMFHGAVSGSPEVAAQRDNNLGIQRDRIVAGLTEAGVHGALLSSGVRDWLDFMVSCTLSWLVRGAPRSQTPMALLLRTLGIVIEECST
ncbi:TetR family transcriptional regulator [Rhodococcoides trifolii]|uniref:TetR family transcriptional regulator n=1 Tax=Rhodococcoides trifolii TaxID=908250 RepID=A0A917LER9_9NOCA|nr:TetR/AcrR family transcriptional regulator [Rhodococcus trifolii]GGG17378.1 TetR family transcriptional regulator [Rhodococcus trifolii]